MLSRSRFGMAGCIQKQPKRPQADVKEPPRAPKWAPKTPLTITKAPQMTPKDFLVNPISSRAAQRLPKGS